MRPSLNDKKRLIASLRHRDRKKRFNHFGREGASCDEAVNRLGLIHGPAALELWRAELERERLARVVEVNE